MKREILFRGKRVDNGEWVEGYLVVNKPSQAYRIITDFALCRNAKYTDNELHHCSGEMILVDNKTVGQFTGLTDKNGNKIFEGDKVELTTNWISDLAPDKDPTKSIRVVEYNKGSFRMGRGGFFSNKFIEAGTLQIIGTIHD